MSVHRSIFKPVVSIVDDAVKKIRRDWVFDIQNGSIVDKAKGAGFVPVEGGHVVYKDTVGVLAKNQSGNWYFEPLEEINPQWLKDCNYWDDLHVWNDAAYWNDCNYPYYTPLYPYFHYGTEMDIVGILKRLTNASITEQRKYPLIHLLTPFDETRLNSEESQVELNFTIANFSDKELTNPQRYQKNMIPVLYPLLDKFELELNIAGIHWPPDNATRSDRVFAMGDDETENLYIDYVDAISFEISEGTARTICTYESEFLN